MTPPGSATERRTDGLTEKEIEDRLRPIKSIRNYRRGDSGTEVQRLDSLFLCCLMAPVNIMHAIAIVDFKREVQQRYEPPMTDRINDTRYPRCPDARMDLKSATMRECTLLPEIVRHERVVPTADGGEKLDCPTPALTVFTEFVVRMLGKSLAELGLIVRLRLKALLDHADYDNNAPVERWEFIGVLKDWIQGFPNLHDQKVPDDSTILKYFPYREWADLRTKRPAVQEMGGTYQFQHEMVAYDFGRLQYIPDYLLSHIIVQGRSKALTYHAIQNKVWTRIFELVFEPGNREITACYDAWRERASSEDVSDARSGCNTIFEPLFSLDPGAYQAYCERGRDNPGNVMESLTGFVLWDLNDATTVWILLLMAIKCSCKELNTTLPKVIQSIVAMGKAASSASMGSEVAYSLREPSSGRDIGRIAMKLHKIQKLTLCTDVQLSKRGAGGGVKERSAAVCVIRGAEEAVKKAEAMLKEIIESGMSSALQQNGVVAAGDSPTAAETKFVGARDAQPRLRNKTRGGAWGGGGAVAGKGASSSKSRGGAVAKAVKKDFVFDESDFPALPGKPKEEKPAESLRKDSSK
ncbi:hypothetical protein Pmar_PMAR026528 [Perkinsus marinus ATCC 50983]|uniref:Uncharacterized protein n=1 Tax=Perkinsus marinus (strain ATCC 50983 / TXsc) TaxID=423536 RepID=C5LDT0_PERM5|nr:hypothetical protein Pmar_PMAR026528 [Perkinsus marinus ATCC 50983]EER05094.1 hypothetical protein Pmar_PMAR026528 [Perkinsus marinus ATCC 50983]|eukprot:XP_002773278.1 hypothetical protein Pmar_PMAR026528 [Perkinsus marinus ATCC 50983]